MPWKSVLWGNVALRRETDFADEMGGRWHGTILSKMVLVPQRIMNSYANGPAAGAYQEGDFVANFHGCAKDKKRNCESEMHSLLSN